ncbi:MAG: aldo/keto reductase [Myxococcales bacterium 68-20]|nr:aldo/keto reductase [Myxococcales bacterium]OJY28825.1 MAG: aldo/keto reductase [Myxococcales bacterium 68-20]
MSDGSRATKTKLGATGPEVFPIALGCMGMSGMYGASSEDEGIATIHAAIDRGVTLIDTGDFYGMGHNEMLVGRALKGGRRDKVQVSVKFGALRGPDGAFIGIDTRPVAVKNFVAHSLTRLGVDFIDIYRPARLDPNVPIEDTIGAIAELVQKGYVRHIGLSEVGADTIRRAHAVHPIVDLQVEYSLISRKPEEKIFPVLAELGISATLYGVLSRGLLSGSKPSGPSDFRSRLPRFSAANRAQNDTVVGAVAAFAAARGQTPAQLAIAWALAKQPRLVPLIGARTRQQLDGALGALDKPLSASELAELERIVPRDAVAGTRYDEVQMAHLDSEH